MHSKFPLLLLHLSLEGDAGTELVCGARRNSLIETVGVDSETEGGTDTGAESLGVAEAKDTSVVDLGLDEGSRVEVPV